MISIWERESFLNYNYIIIGSGIVGLSAAISIKEQEPSSTVIVLERGILPLGASTKNAGFACFGSLSEILGDIKLIGESETLELVNERWEGLQKLRKRLGDTAIDFQNHGGYELIFRRDNLLLQEIELVNSLLYPLFRQSVFRDRSDRIKQFGFSPQHIHALLYNPLEGQIDTGKMYKTLLALATSLNVVVLSGTEVESFEEKENAVEVRVKNDSTFLNFKADKVAICTNAFSKKLLSDVDIQPGRGLVLSTKPIYNLKFEGTFHFNEGFYYFRNFNNRVIFGGGRNLDLAGETTTEFGINSKILEELKYLLSEIILPTTPWELDLVWSGIMAFGTKRKPLITNISKRVIAGVKLSGMGIAIGTNVGERVAKLMIQN